MKKTYVKPAFIAEAYSFTECIAKCEVIPENTHAPILVNAKLENGEVVGDHICTNPNCGHNAGDSHGIFTVDDFPMTIFNDGDTDWDGNTYYQPSDKEHKNPYYKGCDYDWSGSNKFSEDFFGNGSASSGQHHPAFNGYPVAS